MILAAFLAFFTLATLTKTVLLWLNYRHLLAEGSTIPHELEGKIDTGKVSSLVRYNAEKMRFHALVYFLNQALLLIVVLSGVLPFLNETVLDLCRSPVLKGLLFFAVLGLGSWIIDIPFDLYASFVIEKKYNFNTQTVRGWLVDQLKGILLGIVIGGGILLVVFTITGIGGDWWWLIVWIILFWLKLLLTVLYPLIIAPLFNTFVPLEEGTLKDSVQELAEKAAIRVKGIFQMDAGKRTTHTNAYFTGMGRTKRIVLFDTLIEKHPEEEIIAILAHEIGHWKKRHHITLFVLSETFLLAGLYLCSLCIDYAPLYDAFGFEQHYFYVGLFLTGLFAAPVLFIFQPLLHAISRLFEKAADRYAVEVTGDVVHFRDALVRLTADNLANLRPHPAYVTFFYSHPPVLERIQAINSWNDKLKDRHI
jgi:STE24 endopeptidase